MSIHVRKLEELRKEIDEDKELAFSVLDEVENGLKLLDEIENDIAFFEKQKKTELETLENKYATIGLKKKKKDLLLKSIEDFAKADRYVWDEKTQKLEVQGWVLQFRKLPGALQMECSSQELLDALKKKFDDPDFYAKFVRLKLEPDKTELKAAIKTGVLDEQFLKDTKIEIVVEEKFEIKRKSLTR